MRRLFSLLMVLSAPAGAQVVSTPAVTVDQLYPGKDRDPLMPAIVFGDRPYVLVVLVRGMDDEKQGNALIADIARAINGAVTAR